jgi:hypothetical protein
MRKTTETLQNPRDYLIGLSRTNEFIEARRQGDAVPIAMAAAAFRGVESMREAHNGRLDINGNALNLISTLPDFIGGQHELDRIHAKEVRSRTTVPREVKIPYLKKVIPFNHAIRETIDENPQLDATDVHAFIIKTAMGVYKTDEIDFSYLSQQVSNRIIGMHEEIDTEQALWQIDGVDDIENADIDDELEGTDLSFTYQGQPYRIDVKASSAKEQKAWQHWQQGDPLPFWTGINRHELGNQFRANDQQLEIITGRLQDLLDNNLRSDRNYAIV